MQRQRISVVSANCVNVRLHYPYDFFSHRHSILPRNDSYRDFALATCPLKFETSVLMPASDFPIIIAVSAEAAGQRLDLFLTAQLPDVSRARVQQLLAEEKAFLNGSPAKPSLKLKGGETLTILGDTEPPPLRAIAEDIPLDVIYEDADLAVVNKPAGMMVHAGAGATDDARNHGTLVNALLHRFAKLSAVGGETRPGIVHRLDKDTSGLILIARNDAAHRNLAKQFSGRAVKKRYIALV